eukprot:gnl/Dysnectes_brevis/844_a931_4046.p1 GENE.gnl/Dysnectes_brevis/844_a931_4046~~gnl/Dysnectes_brevis/844_a931_4046.p1  ORF type:complete len:550 (+),score=182.35 gnl/Dysnectes_brevis/844_a931_4046:38-1651(+)
MSTAVHTLNPKAEHIRRSNALQLNVSAAEGIMQILKTNFGPTGTLKMLVSGAGEIKITKDGAVLLKELPIKHPTVALIARTATAQDDITGDGTTATILLIGELMRQARRWLSEDVHPRIIVDGFSVARDETIEYLEKQYAIERVDQVTKLAVAKSVLGTKVHHSLRDQLAEICVKAVDTIHRPGHMLDLHMVEIMQMMHRSDMDSELIQGIVMDHGGRHRELVCEHFENCHILTLNLDLEQERSEVNSGMFYKSAEHRAELVAGERAHVNRRIEKIITLKNEVCKPGENFVVLNQKGIDGVALDQLAAAGIFSLRRVKRRNMERLTLCCGGFALNIVDDITAAHLGYAKTVRERILGEEKFTFVEGVSNPHSCTILVRGPNKHTILQIKDALRDGLRAVKNLIVDKKIVPGGGAFEMSAAEYLDSAVIKKCKGKVKLGVQAFAEALRAVPKTLAKNSGFDVQDSILRLQSEHQKDDDHKAFGLDLKTGLPADMLEAGVLDNYRVKHQLIHSATVIASQLLTVDEVLKAGRALRAEDQ